MTHTPSHIIITSFGAAITENGKWKVWHAATAIALVSFIAGAVIF